MADRGLRAPADLSPNAPADPGRRVLADLIAGSRRVALVGLAKNTGKTQTLLSILAEHDGAGRTVGVTSIGRDGEARDAIDARIPKPLIELQAGSLVATTDALLRASGLRHELLDRTGIRTPLGEVLLARLSETGTLEVAGPSTGEDLREIGSAMLRLGADQVLIDGSIDRRAASSPAVSEGLVMATGAVLGEDLRSVVKATTEAVELTGLPAAGPLPEPPLRVPAKLVLDADPQAIAGLLREHPQAEVFEVVGALGERFLEGLLSARRERAGRALTIIARDPTSVFLTAHGPGWYLRQGIAVEVRKPIELLAITVNPVAPLRHRFESAELRASIEAAIPGVSVLDVLAADYLALAK
jgi:hypothetical protein